jgi:PKD repeat protein
MTIRRTLLTGLMVGLLLVTTSAAAVVIEGCPIFPSNNVWNTRIDTLPTDTHSAVYVSTIGSSKPVHPDFGSGTWDGGPIGIPYVVVNGSQPAIPVSFYYPDESDPGPYPVPSTAPVEGGPDATGDRHVLVIDRDHHRLYELYDAHMQADRSWDCGSGAVFDLNDSSLRPAGWTSADAAGLPILPGLVRYDEVASGAITHAIRFTAPQTRGEYIWPARHEASSLTGIQYPPLGQRFRLKTDYDISGFSPEVQVILTALKEYGMILADNGSSWYLSGSPDERWNNDLLHELQQVKGSAFDAVDESSLMISPDSAAARQRSLIIPGGQNVPSDPDGDGRYEDLDGNGVTDFSDVVLFFNQMDWISEDEPAGLFDFNQNGRVDFDDVIRVFGML